MNTPESTMIARGYVVRLAQSPTDYEDIVRGSLAILKETEYEAEFPKQQILEGTMEGIRRHEGTYFLAVDNVDGGYVGQLKATVRFSDFLNAEFLHAEHAYVLPAMRRTGALRAMMSAAEKHFGVRRWALMVVPENHQARICYEKMGFRCQGQWMTK